MSAAVRAAALPARTPPAHPGRPAARDTALARGHDATARHERTQNPCGARRSERAGPCTSWPHDSANPANRARDVRAPVAAVDELAAEPVAALIAEPPVSTRL